MPIFFPAGVAFQISCGSFKKNEHAQLRKRYQINYLIGCGATSSVMKATGHLA
jgi:hypothetical protein